MRITWLLLVSALMAFAFYACGDDDEEVTDPTDTSAKTAAPSDTAPAEPPGEEDAIAAATAFLAAGTEGAPLQVTDPPKCEDVQSAIDAGTSTIEEFIGPDLVCLLSPQVDGDSARVPFGPFASEVIGIVVLGAQGGAWEATGIEPAPTF